jgi:DNA gyrase inhibitor GyrI
MSKLDVQIVTLPPMRVISAYGYGSQPEDKAGRKMTEFLKAKGLLSEYGSGIAHYGFNNPSPSHGSPNYGYEIWAQVPAEVEPEGDLKVVNYEGGLYAVTRFENLENIGKEWGELVRWREASAYREGTHQWLEHLLNPLVNDPAKFIFELFLPIRK